MRLLLPLWLALVGLAWPASAAERKPNIVLIFADDLGVNDLHCYGRQEHQTPNLDRLAAEGMRFTNALCAQPICSPSRAALLTGHAPARLHLTTYLPGRPDAPSQKVLHPEIRQALPLEEQTLAELLKPHGYASACVGKWHLGGPKFGPDKQGFDFVFTTRPNTEPSATEGGKGEYGKTAKAIEFIEANRDRPFFLYLAHDTPHIPLAAQPALVEKYRDTFNATYAAMMETMDSSIGLLLAKLEELKLAENTIVIFTSDNGGLHVLEYPDSPATHHGWLRGGKGFLYEGGLREPLIVRWPGKVPASKVEEQPMVLADLMPTLLELAGAPVPEGLDYVSITPVLLGQGTIPPRELFWHFPHFNNQGGRPSGAMRDGPWKLIEFYDDGHAELYDLSNDPKERTDLGRQQPDRVAAMRGKLAAWRQKVGAQENTPNPGYDDRLGRVLYRDVDASLVPTALTAAEVRDKMQPWRTKMNEVVPRKNAPGAANLTGGFVLLHARDAKVQGASLRYEPQPHKNTLGAWRQMEDSASWSFTLPEAGRYRVEVLQAAGKGSGGATVELQAGEQRVSFVVEETGHFQNFVPRTVGEMTLPAGEHTLKLVAKSKPGPAVMDLRQVTLTRLMDTP